MTSNIVASDDLAASTAVAGMTADQQRRLTELLDDYLQGLEQGEPVDVDQLIAENRDLESVLREYLAKLDNLHGIAAGFRKHDELEPLISGDSNASVQSLQLGDYTIIRQLGRGGMGIVYEARQRTLNRRVALKLLPMASMLDSRQIARFKNESYAAAQLQHPNIVPVHNVGVHRGIHYYAMQFIEGQTIDSWIASSVDTRSVTQWRESICFAIDIAHALQCAHECGIVHRDIKPSNLMLDHDGRAWVTDFGLARCQNDLSLTLSGDVVGTMRYMSPEQACGRAELVDQRTDVYSLGATLYEMLTGQAAVRGDDGPAVLQEIVSDSPPRLRRVMPHVPADLEVVLQKAMAKERDDRYTTAREFAEDLQAVLDNRPTLAKPPSLAKRASRWASRHRKSVMAASIGLTIGFVALFVGVLIFAEQNRSLKSSNQYAQLYLHKAQEAVNELGSYEAQLASVPGAERIRQSLLREILSYNQEFVAQAAGNEQLRGELALTHSRIGSLVRELESAQQSIPHFERSAEIFAEVARESPPTPELVRGMSQNMNQLALALADAGRTNQALAAYEQAISWQSTLVDQQDESSDRSNLALTRSNFGLLLGRMGQVQFAHDELAFAIEQLKRLVDADADNTLAARGLSAALSNLSALSLDTDPAESIRLLESALDRQLAQRGKAPNPLKASDEIAATYDNLGGAYLKHGQANQAAAAFSKAVEIRRRLHSIAPKVDAYRFELAMSLSNLATALHADDKDQRAYEAASEAVTLQEVCLADETPVPSSISRLGVMYSNLGTSLEGLSEARRAEQAYRNAIEHQQSALRVDVESKQTHGYLLQHYASLLRLQIRQQHWRDADDTSRSCLAATRGDPAALLAFAEQLARLTTMAPAGDRRERIAAHSATALLAARRAGIEEDRRRLEREPFRSVAQLTSFQKVLQP